MKKFIVLFLAVFSLLLSNPKAYSESQSKNRTPQSDVNFSKSEVDSLFEGKIVTKVEDKIFVLESIWPLKTIKTEIVTEYRFGENQTIYGLQTAKTYPPKTEVILLIIWFIAPFLFLIFLSTANRREETRKLIYFYLVNITCIVIGILIGRMINGNVLSLMAGLLLTLIVNFFVCGLMGGLFPNKDFILRGKIIGNRNLGKLIGGFLGAVPAFVSTILLAHANKQNERKEVLFYLVFYTFFCLISLIIRELSNGLILRKKVKLTIKTMAGIKLGEKVEKELDLEKGIEENLKKFNKK